MFRNKVSDDKIIDHVQKQSRSGSTSSDNQISASCPETAANINSGLASKSLKRQI